MGNMVESGYVGINELFSVHEKCNKFRKMHTE